MISYTHPSWHEILNRSYKSLDKEYREFLEKDDSFFPDRKNLFNAFKLPLNQTRYILFGQDPYPRKESAIGYAFIDGKVGNIFSDKGLSKEVNKATSLRNFIKMLLVAEGELRSDLSQEAIKKVNKSSYIKTLIQLKANFEKNGVMLLNTALIFTKKEESNYHIKMWRPFMKSLLKELEDSQIELILFGKMADELKRYDETRAFKTHSMPHPYNISFIHDKDAHKLFSTMTLLNL